MIIVNLGRKAYIYICTNQHRLLAKHSPNNRCDLRKESKDVSFALTQTRFANLYRATGEENIIFQCL
jgi:hypothetical protein